MRRSWINSRRDIGSPISARSATLAIATITAKKFFNADHIERVIAGFCAAQANTVLVGVPLLLQTFGEAGAMPLFLLLAVHLPLIATATTLLIEVEAKFSGLCRGRYTIQSCWRFSSARVSD